MKGHAGPQFHRPDQPSTPGYGQTGGQQGNQTALRIVGQQGLVDQRLRLLRPGVDRSQGIEPAPGSHPQPQDTSRCSDSFHRGGRGGGGWSQRGLRGIHVADDYRRRRRGAARNKKRSQQPDPHQHTNPAVHITLRPCYGMLAA